jgi:acetyl-CoA carboxylase biotin carboxyl carrier protein
LILNVALLILQSNVCIGGNIMNLEEIKDLMKEFGSSEMSVLEIKNGQFSIKMKKGGEAPVAPVYNQAATVPNIQPVVNQPAKAPESKPEADTATKVKAPLVGVFYASSAPGEEPFAKVGQQVKKGDTLCLIEAMKMINEVPSPVSGRIKKVLAENEELVSFDQVIFEIEE